MNKSTSAKGFSCHRIAKTSISRSVSCQGASSASDFNANVCNRRLAGLQLSSGIIILHSMLCLVRKDVATAGEVSAGPRMPTGELKAVLDAALKKVIVKSKAPVALRLIFHDAATYSVLTGDGGANASIRFELDRPESFGLKRGWNLITQLKSELARTPAAGQVSAADLVALAGAAAVRVTGGPVIDVPIGRQDAVGPDPEGRLPLEFMTAEQLKQCFAEKGLSVQEMVVLSGSHTLGSKGYGDPVTFDNTYFKALLQKPWNNKSDPMADMIGLPSDHVLPDDEECLPFIQRYATDQSLFFRDFSAAYVKMTCLGAKWI